MRPRYTKRHRPTLRDWKLRSKVILALVVAALIGVGLWVAVSAQQQQDRYDKCVRDRSRAAGIPLGKDASLRRSAIIYDCDKLYGSP